jgi:ATP-binding cassette subfamily B multidrug efflux pump
MPMEFGYMEGDHLGKPYDLALWLRLGRYAAPHLRLILLAAVILLLAAGADLLMPYLVRLAIDRHILRNAVEVRLSPDKARLTARFQEQAGDGLIPLGEGRAMIPEERLRGLDPRLVSRMREAGLIKAAQYYMAPTNEETAALAAKHPAWFISSQGRYFISQRDMARLNGDELSRMREPDVLGLLRLAALYLVAALLAFGLGFAQRVILEKTGQEMMFSLRQELWTHLLTRSLGFFHKRPVGKLVTRLTNDVANLNEMYRNAMVGFCQDFFLLIGIMLVLLWLDWELGLVCLYLAPVIGVLAWVFSRMARNAFRALQGHLGRINARLSETLSGLLQVKLYNAQEQGSREFESLNQAYFQAGMRQIKVFTLFFPLTDLLSSLAVGLIIWYGGGQVVQEKLSLGTLVAFLLYMQMFFRPVRDMAEKFNILQSAMASAERIFHLQDNKETLPRKSQGLESCPGPGRVEFRGIRFGYDPNAPVLKDISFTIPEGEMWAVVGPTGAGKTSLVAMLCRLYDPQQGEVLIDGLPVHELSPECLAAKVAMVSQEVYLFAGSVAKNLSLDRPGVDREALKRALQISGAAGFVNELPRGMETELGEGGLSLSAGQRQLLSLARALAGGPDILVLDEATSSVDPESERLMQQALPRMMAGRTALVVAHRLSTIKRADNILVMQAGRVIEQGRHEELLAKGGMYTRLVRLQRIRKGLEESHGHGA